jgi:chloride channel protein, CIC family
MRVRKRLNRFFVRAGFPRNWWLIPLAAIIGSVSGLVAHGYGYLVQCATAFFYGGESDLSLLGRRDWLLVALPALGGLIVGVIKTVLKLAPNQPRRARCDGVVGSPRRPHDLAIRRL